MKVRLAGYNVNKDVLKRLKRKEDLPLTPETISAAYARISRSSKDITSLHREACLDVAKARRSNQRIIFDMGHHSVAEHAVFNFDIMKVSRIALEEVERFRLVSYTEKSQRYVTLIGDYVLPAEIREKKDQALFHRIVQKQNIFYQKAFTLMRERLAGLYPRLLEKHSGQNLVEGRAKEDARYALPLATFGQVGMTINARNLEHLFRRFSLSFYQEVQQIGKKLFSLVQKVAPSLILFPKPSSFETEVYSCIQERLSGFPEKTRMNPEPEIVHTTEGGEDCILASFLSSGKGHSFPHALKQIRNLSKKEKKNLYLQIFKKMEFFDAPPREFEMVEIVFQSLVSASCFAQLKRHRMATLLAGPYAPEWGNTFPESIREIGLEKEFREIVEATNEGYRRIIPTSGYGATYLLTNSHRRPVLMKMNLRELYHFIRLRDDEHAQWDIRSLAAAVLHAVKKRLPYSSLMLCGKSQFAAEYEKLFKSRPGFLI